MSRSDFTNNKCYFLDKENAPQKQNIKEGEQIKCRIISQKILKRPVLLMKQNKIDDKSTLLKSQSIQSADINTTKDWSSQSKFQIFNEPSVDNDSSKDQKNKHNEIVVTKKNTESIIDHSTSKLSPKNDLPIKNNNEIKPIENIKASKLAFQRAKSFFINKEIESSKYKTNELCSKMKNESQKIHGILKRQASLAAGFKYDGTLVNRRIQQLKIEELKSIEETPLYLLNNLPKLEEVKILHNQRGLNYRNCHPQLKDSKSMSRHIAYCEIYSTDIIQYYHDIEKKRQLNSNKLNITYKERQTMISFIIMTMTMNSFSSSTLYIAVRIFEDVVRIFKNTVDNLQLIALVAMWIAIKRDSITYIIPTAQKIADFSNGAFTDEDVRKCECEILSAIEFDLAYADPSFIMSYCLVTNSSSIIASDDKIAKAYYFGSYMIDLSLLDDQLMSISPILLAITVGEIAIGLIIQPEKYLRLIHFEQWRTDFARKHFEDSDIYNIRSKIVRCIVESCTVKSYSRVIYKKYKRTRYGAISDELIKKVSMLV